MRKKIFVVLILLFFLMLTSKGFSYEKGDKYITPQWVFGFDAIRVGVAYGIMFTDNIEVGASLFYYHYTEEPDGFLHTHDMIKFSADFLYHINLIKMEKLDTFAGINVGPAIDFHKVEFTPGYSINNTKFIIHGSPFIGARYYIKKDLALFGKIFISYYSISKYLAINGAFGITLKK